MIFLGKEEGAMELREALALLEDGHTVLRREVAREICEVVGVSFDEELVMRWESREEAQEVFGFLAVGAGSGAGVDSLDLSYHIARELGLGAPGAVFLGRGRQAELNLRAIREELVGRGRL
jgi:hypothetical protein